MSSDSLQQMQQGLPSAEKVYDLLQVLVKGEGLRDRSSIERHGEPLRWLPCVEGARIEHQLNDEDWPVALRAAVDCIAGYGGSYPGLNGKFLRRVLGIDGHLGSLTSRVHDFLAEEPRWKIRSENAVASQRAFMLEEFAGRLRIARNYPCSTPDVSIRDVARLLLHLVESERQSVASGQQILDQRSLRVNDFEKILERTLNAWRIDAPPKGRGAKLKLLLDEVVAPVYKNIESQWVEFYPQDSFLTGWESLYLLLSGEQVDRMVDIREVALVAGILMSPKGSVWFTPEIISEISRDAFSNRRSQGGFYEVTWKMPTLHPESHNKDGEAGRSI